MNETQRRTLQVPEECIACMPKGTSWAEAMLNSEKIKPIALAVTSYAGLKASVS